MKVSFKKVKNISEFIDSIRLRTDVFIIEQRCPPGWEPDELDKIADHFIAAINDEIVATIRLREKPEGIGKLERLVVKKEHRKKGIGSNLIKYAVEHARKKGLKKVWLQGQKRAQKTFEKAGFRRISEEYDLFNLGIPHIDMELRL